MFAKRKRTIMSSVTIFSTLKCVVLWAICRSTLSIYVPNEIDQTPKPYTTGLKIKTSHYKALAEPYYHSNYSKVYVHNKNYTSSLLDGSSATSPTRDTQLHPVYISEEKKEKIRSVLNEHNTNVVEKDSLNNRVVYKRRIEKSKDIEVFNKCPKGVTGQFVYDLSCNQYLDCWNGRGGPSNCAPGTLFNPKTLECDFPEKVECLTGPTGSSIILQKSAKLQSSYEQAKCPEDFSGLIPNYTDCSRFVQCNNGIQTPRNCPPGTLFDTNLNVCNHEKDSTCFFRRTGSTSGIQEEFGGSTDTSSLYTQYGSNKGVPQSGYGRYTDNNRQSQVQEIAYGQGKSTQFYSQETKLYQDRTSQPFKSQGQGTSGCDPTNPYCKSGGYIISGNGIYNMYPQSVSSHLSSVRDSRPYYGSLQGEPCNPQLQDCKRHGAYNHQGHSQGLARGTVYIQYVMCNPSAEDCSKFQQGTFMLGPGGALCNPANQQCGRGTTYIPSNKMSGATQNTLPSSGTYFVKYVMCNTAQEDCALYQKGVIEAGYGVPGTLIGAYPVSQVPPECSPQTQNCDTPQFPTSSASESHGNPGQPCNSQYQECGQGFQGNTYQYQGQQRPAVPSNNNQISGSRSKSGQPCNPLYEQCDPVSPECSHQTQNCGIRQFPTSSASQTSGPQGKSGQHCNPRYQECGQGFRYQGQQKQSDTQTSGSHSKSGQPCNPIYQECDQSPGGQIPPECSPQTQNCDTPQFPTPSASESHGNPGQPCNPQYQECGQGLQGNTYQYQGQQRPAVPSNNNQISGSGSKSGQPCNPLYQECALSPGGLVSSECNPQTQNCNTASYHQGQNRRPGVLSFDPINGPQGEFSSSGSDGLGTQGYGQGATHSRYPGYYPQTRNSTTNYRKVCTAGDENCYQHHRVKSLGNRDEGGKAECPYGFQGITKHPTNCKKYLNCANGITYVQDCGPGTLFNPILRVCDFPYNVDCKDEESETTTFEYSQHPDGYHQEQQGPYDNIQGCHGEACQGRASCQGSHCIPKQEFGGQGPREEIQGLHNCRGPHCSQGKVQFQQPGSGGYNECVGSQCAYKPPGFTQGQSKCRGSDCSSHIQGQTSRPEENGNIMKIPTKTGNQPINKSDRITSGGFNNQRSVDYVDIFDPNESKNLAYATTTQRSQKPNKQVWPPPFPDLTTDAPDADYVFEYEDGETVTLAPENVHVEKRKKSRCGESDFMCDKWSCVAKNFVCDGAKDCDDGKDEKYCERYMYDFKPYKNSRLDVLEKQRWDNVTYFTCALLCMDNNKFECKSFNYRKVDRACFLTNENIGSSGALKNYYPCDYYERKSTSFDCSDMHKCPNGRCLASEQICDGYDDCGDRADESACRAEDFGYSVKLAAGETLHEGRVEVTVFGKTGYICDDQFGMADADVLCKELGFKLGALEVKGNSYYAKDLTENHTLYMMDDIECLGNETSIMQCNFAGWGIHNCADREIVGVICKTPQKACSEGYWKCDTGNDCVKMPFVCDGLDDCTDNSDESSHYCDSPTELRLVNGTRPTEGRLEIRHNGIWGSICDDDFNEDAAKIVCRSLGYFGSASFKKEAFFGESTGPIWLDQVSCKGNESTLEKCTHWDWGEHNCDHSEDVAIVCSDTYVQVEPKRNSKHYGGEVTGSIKDLEISDSSHEPVSCGYRKDNIFLQSDDVHFRVVQGSVAKPGDYPWQAALRINGQEKTAHWCGAVVIASKWVLTAAHCLEGYPKGAYIVVAGEYNIDEDEGTEQQAFIEEYYLHENFRKGHKMGNDIAMVMLKGNGFKLNQDIQPICLPDETADYERELNCTISGFGTVQTGRSAYSHKLRAAWIPVQKMDVCKMAHIYGENIGEGMICAGDLTGGVDACDGDSGGPLACLDEGVFTLYGLTSWGQRCGYANKPGVYVKVSHYQKWITQIMKLHS